MNSHTQSYDSKVIQTRLRRLRASVRGWFVMSSLGVLVFIAVILLAIAGLGDYWFRFDQAQRIFLLILIGVFVVYWVRKKLLKPLAHLPDEEALCARADASHPEAEERIISALQLGRHHDVQGLGMSPVLAQEVITEGVAAAEKVKFNTILDHGRRNRSIFLGVVAVVAVIVFAIMAPSMAGIWFQRNLLLGDAAWPQRTHLHYVGDWSSGSTVIVPSGESFDVTVAVTEDSVVPSQLKLLIQQVDGSESDQPLRHIQDRLYRITLPAIVETTKVQAYGGDGRTSWLVLKPVVRPRITGLQVTIHPPAYTGLEKKIRTADRDFYKVLVGSRVTISGTANTKLSSVTANNGSASGVNEVVVDANDSRRFTTEFTVHDLTARDIGFSLLSADGLHSGSGAQLRFRPEKDHVPVVQAALKGVGSMVAPKAVIPIHYQARDDYGLKQAHLHVEAQFPDKAEPEVVEVPLKFSTSGIPESDGVTTGPQITHFDLQGRKFPAGTILNIKVTAHDNDSSHDPAYKVASSSVLSVRVVEESVLRAELLRREQQLREEIELMVSMQKRNLDHLQGMLGDARSALVSDEVKRDLSQIIQIQGTLGGRSRAVGSRYQAILEEMLSNRFEHTDTENYKRITGNVIAPLNRIAVKGTPEVVSALEKSRGEQSEKAALATLNQAVKGQQAILDTLKAVLGHMTEISFRQSLNIYRKLIEAQTEINRKTKSAADETIEDLFEE